MSPSSPAVSPLVEKSLVHFIHVRWKSAGRRSAGFTLIELLAVIAIVAVITALVISVGQHAAQIGKIARAKAELVAIAAALESFKRDYGDYPRTDHASELLQSLIGMRGPTGTPIAGRVLLDLAHFTTGDADDPFTSSAAELVDPWQRPYMYAYRSTAPWTNPGFVLCSAGADGLIAELSAGGMVNTDAAANLDNIFADR